MNNMLILGGLVASAAVTFWPQIKQMLGKSNPLTGNNMPPHAAVNTILQYFVKQESKAGIDAASMCGKLLYDASVPANLRSN